MEKVLLGAGAAGFNWLPVLLAQKQGLFAKRGVEVEIKRMGTVGKATEGVLSGELHLAITPPEGAIRNHADGGPLRIVGANANQLPLSLIANPRIKRVEDLKSAKLGTSSLTEGTALYTMEILAKHGLAYPGDYEFAVVGVHPARWAALQDGSIDAAVQPVPFNFMAEDAGYANLGEATDYIPDLLFTAILVNDNWAQAHRTALIAVLAGLIEATRIIYEATEDGPLLDVLVELTESNMSYAERALVYMRKMHLYPDDASVSPAAFAKTLEIMAKVNPADAALAKTANASIDDSYRLEAVAAAG